MANLDAFTNPDFDPKQYLNEVCAAKDSAEPADRYLAELEMKLHLASEDISIHLEEQATRASQRIPATIRELLHIKDDVLSVRGAVTTTLSQLERDTSATPAATSAVSALEELDAVKRRMEDACNTLKEAAGLSSLFHMVDDFFAAGDYRRIAESLSGIQRGLSIVGDSVPEFRDGQERLARLEDRFAAAVEAPLATAFTKQKAEDALAFVDMLASIGKEDTVKRLYTAARIGPLQALWDSYTQGTPFISWLSTFYDQFLHTIASESSWCQLTLPSRFPGLVLALVSTFLSKIDKPFRSRLAASLTGATGSMLPLEALEQAQDTVADFSSGLYAALGAVNALGGDTGPDFNSLYQQITSPVEALLQGYADRELQYLTAELQESASACSNAALNDPDIAAKALSDSIAQALSSAEASLTRCLRITQGTSLPALTRVLERVLQQHISSLKAVLPNLRGRTAKDASSFAASEPVLPLLLVAAKCCAKVQALNAAIVQAAQTSIPGLLNPQPSTDPTNTTTTSEQGMGIGQGIGNKPNAAQLRLQAHPELIQQLSAFYTAASTSAALLPSTTTAAKKFKTGAGRLVEDMLCAKIYVHLGGVAELPEWQARPAGQLALPTFTPYPLQYITSVGEYLMMLPQLLESSLGAEEDSDDAGQLVADWIDRIALSAAQLYHEQMSQMQSLSEQGSAQLAADLEYFTNVLTTLGVAIPSVLATWHAATSAPADQILLVAEAARESEDPGTSGIVEVVAKLRGLKVSTPQSARAPQH